MAKLVWDQLGEKQYETGVSKGVLFPMTVTGDAAAYGKGIAWDGLTSVSESPSGAEPTALYANNSKYLTMLSTEELGLTIEAYTYPTEFEACDGTATPVTGMSIGQQSRNSFAFCYRTEIGNDVSGTDAGYKIHIVYGCFAQPSEKAFSSINDSPEAITFSWTVTTTPVEVGTIGGKTYKPTAMVTINSTHFADAAGKAKLAKVEEALYGTTTKESSCPTPNEIYTMLTTA